MAESSTSAGDITRLLQAVGEKQPGSSERLLREVAGELRSLAAGHLAGWRRRRRLQTTELVNEAYVRMFGRPDLVWENRRHFYFAAARAMRDIIVEHVRREATRKRGGDRARVPMAIDGGPEEPAPAGILEVNEALEALHAHDARCADVVLPRFFGGHTYEEVARLMGLTLTDVRRDWAYSRAWLRRFLER